MHELTARASLRTDTDSARGGGASYESRKRLLLVAVTLIFVALLVGITGANPANPANTNTGTVHREGAHTNTGTAHTEGEFSSTGGGFTFTGTLQYK